MQLHIDYTKLTCLLRGVADSLQSTDTVLSMPSGGYAAHHMPYMTPNALYINQARTSAQLCNPYLLQNLPSGTAAFVITGGFDLRCSI